MVWSDVPGKPPSLYSLAPNGVEYHCDRLRALVLALETGAKGGEVHLSWDGDEDAERLAYVVEGEAYALAWESVQRERYGIVRY